jgi:hypothetical protein
MSADALHTVNVADPWLASIRIAPCIDSGFPSSAVDRDRAAIDDGRETSRYLRGVAGHR